MTVKHIISRSVPAFSAASIATGNISAAAALFVTRRLIRVVPRYTAPSKPASASVMNNNDVSQELSHVFFIQVSGLFRELTADANTFTNINQEAGNYFSQS